MEKKQHNSACGFGGKFLIAFLLVISGILLFARNMGWMTEELFSLVVSWYSLFIVLGIYAMVRRHFISGIALLLIGAYFLLGGLACLPENSQAMVWPLALVLGGILFLVKARKRERWMDRHCGFRPGPWNRGRMNMNDFSEQQNDSSDGFLHSDNSFTGMRHVVLDEIFKGGNIRTVWGGTIIDLRHTHLAPGETYIDLDCNCGGVELYVPTDWSVSIKCDAFFGGCEDKRWQNKNIDKERILVIRGKISFGGLVIKD